MKTKGRCEKIGTKRECHRKQRWLKVSRRYAIDNDEVIFVLLRLGCKVPLFNQPETRHSLKLKERSWNVYENRGPL
jgi:hypothetical protein